jgi:hypothetical protein
MKKTTTTHPLDGQLLGRLVACNIVGGALEMMRGAARQMRDKDLAATTGRLQALLDHEMRTFLNLPVGLKK